MKSGDSETKELVCDKHSEKAAAPCPAESAESKQVARAAYDHIDSAQTLDEWKLVIATVCLSGHPSNNEQHLRRQCIIRCSRQLLCVLEWFSDLNWRSAAAIQRGEERIRDGEEGLCESNVATLGGPA